MGRRVKLRSDAISRIDAWISARPGRRKDYKVLASRLGIGITTLFKAIHRREGYRAVPRG